MLSTGMFCQIKQKSEKVKRLNVFLFHVPVEVSDQVDSDGGEEKEYGEHNEEDPLEHGGHPIPLEFHNVPRGEGRYLDLHWLQNTLETVAAD